MHEKNNEAWDVDRRTGVERRHYEMPENVTLADIWRLVSQHIHDEEVFRENIIRSFPKNRHGEPDFEGHGEYHERLIERAAKLEQRRERMIEKFLIGSSWATIVVVAGWALTGAVQWLKGLVK